MSDDRPAWARRMTNEREARNWSQADAVTVMRLHAPTGSCPTTQPAAAVEALGVRRGHAGRVLPAGHRGDVRHRHHAMFPEFGRRDADADDPGRQRNGHPRAGQPLAAL